MADQTDNENQKLTPQEQEVNNLETAKANFQKGIDYLSGLHDADLRQRTINDKKRSIKQIEKRLLEIANKTTAAK